MKANFPCLELLDELAGRCAGELKHELAHSLDELRHYLQEQDQQSQIVAKAQADAIVNSALMMAQLEETQAQLVQAQRKADELRIAAECANAAKSVFLASMSHEIRTPLTAIIGYSELLQEDAELSGNVNTLPDLQKIHTAGKHLLSLISNILDISKIEAGMMELLPEEFDVPALLGELTKTIAPIVENNGNRFVVEISQRTGRMKADKPKVCQILFNLLSNAAKFTKNSHVQLAANREMAAEGDTIRFMICDGGIGIAPEHIESVFQEFNQGDNSTTRKYGGTGLGLAICKKLCHMMGGEISVQSELGKGTTFTVCLPAVFDAKN
jgi:signal transduction histidine kinase